MADQEKHPFWQFSINVYAQDGVPEACIRLQEEHGIDVNVLLFCCWSAAIGNGALTREELAAARNAVMSWNREIVQGLRAVRNFLKDGYDGIDIVDSEALRQRVLGIEINAEHKEQIRLAAAVPLSENLMRPDPKKLIDCVDTISCYFGLVRTKNNESGHAALILLLTQVFPEVSSEEIAKAAGKV